MFTVSLPPADTKLHVFIDFIFKTEFAQIITFRKPKVAQGVNHFLKSDFTDTQHIRCSNGVFFFCLFFLFFTLKGFSVGGFAAGIKRLNGSERSSQYMNNKSYQKLVEI